MNTFALQAWRSGLVIAVLVAWCEAYLRGEPPGRSFTAAVLCFVLWLKNHPPKDPPTAADNPPSPPTGEKKI